MQYKIPQNVGIEDKIVGPFSLRQLIILAIGGGISYVLFAITSRIYELNILEYILIAFPALFALAMAVIKIHNVSFGKYILLTLEFAIKPKKRLWDHRGISALVAPDLSDKKSKKKEIKEVKTKKNVNLSDLSATLDSGGFEHIEKVAHEDIDEVNDDDLITEAYFGHKKEESETENMYWRTRDMQKKKLDLLAKMTPAQPVAIPVVASPVAVVAPPPVAPPVPEPPSMTPTPVPVPKAPEPNEVSEKKESVTQHLANVIKEARQNNQVKEETEKTIPEEVEQTTPKAQPEEAKPADDQPKKKRKRRRRKKKNLETGPVRQNTQVNTTSKSEPNKHIKKNTNKHEGETSFSDLSEGNEIEFNLD